MKHEAESSQRKREQERGEREGSRGIGGEDAECRLLTFTHFNFRLFVSFLASLHLPALPPFLLHFPFATVSLILFFPYILPFSFIVSFIFLPSLLSSFISICYGFPLVSVQFPSLTSLFILSSFPSFSLLLKSYLFFYYLVPFFNLFFSSIFPSFILSSSPT